MVSWTLVHHFSEAPSNAATSGLDAADVVARGLSAAEKREHALKLLAMAESEDGGG